MMIINRKMHQKLPIIHKKIYPNLDISKIGSTKFLSYFYILCYLLKAKNTNMVICTLFFLLTFGDPWTNVGQFAQFCENYWFLFSHWVVRAGVVLAKIYIFPVCQNRSIKVWRFFWGKHINWVLKATGFHKHWEHLVFSTFLWKLIVTIYFNFYQKSRSTLV